jgi:hypothetical protein
MLHRGGTVLSARTEGGRVHLRARVPESLRALLQSDRRKTLTKL